MPSVNTRVFFSKTGRAKYISHLDLSHTVIRAMRRARLPVWQTEGYNPHTYVAFMLPLSLGQEGLREAMDFRLTEPISPEETAERLNAALPPDIRVISVAEPKRKGTDIASAEYNIMSSADPDKLRALCESERIIVQKKTKKGVTEVDLKPLISGLSLDGGNMVVRLPAGNDFSINPSLLFEAYAAEYGEKVSRLRIVRTRIFCADGEEFS